jgi:hypothetical protein
MGWFDFGGNKPIPENTTSIAKLMGSIWMVIAEQIDQTVALDSAFYPPAGSFILSCRDSTPTVPSGFMNIKLTPQFVMCTEVADPPCDINFGVRTILCGDADLSDNLDIADIVFLVQYVFNHGSQPMDPSGGDFDCDSSVTIADAVYYVNYIFSGGPAPCAGCR